MSFLGENIIYYYLYSIIKATLPVSCSLTESSRYAEERMGCGRLTVQGAGIWPFHVQHLSRCCAVLTQEQGLICPSWGQSLHGHTWVTQAFLYHYNTHPRIIMYLNAYLKPFCNLVFAGDWSFYCDSVEHFSLGSFLFCNQNWCKFSVLVSSLMLVRWRHERIRTSCYWSTLQLEVKFT